MRRAIYIPWILAAACGGPRAGAPAIAAATASADPATTGAVAGTVREQRSGAPLSFAVIAVGDRSETTGADGAFRIDGLAAGEHAVAVHYANLSLRWGSVAIAAGGELRLDIVIDPGTADAADGAQAGRVSGTVIDQNTREPIEGAVVTLLSPLLRDAQMAVTDERGVWQVLGLPAGTYTISIYYSLVDYGAIEFRKAGVQVSPDAAVEIPIELDTHVTGSGAEK